MVFLWFAIHKTAAFWLQACGCAWSGRTSPSPKWPRPWRSQGAMEDRGKVMGKVVENLGKLRGTLGKNTQETWEGTDWT